MIHSIHSFHVVKRELPSSYLWLRITNCWSVRTHCTYPGIGSCPFRWSTTSTVQCSTTKDNQYHTRRQTWGYVAQKMRVLDIRHLSSRARRGLWLIDKSSVFTHSRHRFCHNGSSNGVCEIWTCLRARGVLFTIHSSPKKLTIGSIVSSSYLIGDSVEGEGNTIPSHPMITPANITNHISLLVQCKRKD